MMIKRGCGKLTDEGESWIMPDRRTCCRAEERCFGYMTAGSTTVKQSIGDKSGNTAARRFGRRVGGGVISGVRSTTM